MNNKGADQTAWMHRLICAFVVCIWQKQVLSWCGSLRDTFRYSMSTHNMCFLWRTIENYPLVITKYPIYLFHWFCTHPSAGNWLMNIPFFTHSCTNQICFLPVWLELFNAQQVCHISQAYAILKFHFQQFCLKFQYILLPGELKIFSNY